MSKRQFTIGMLAIKPSDALVLRSIMRLFSSQFEYDWRFGQHTEADVVFIDPAVPEMRNVLNRSKVTGAPYCVSIAYDNRQSTSGVPNLNPPLRVRDVIQLLKSYETDSVQQARRVEPAMDSGAAASALAESFSNALALVSSIQKAVARDANSDLILNCDGFPVFRINARRASFCAINDSPLASTDGATIVQRLGGLCQPVTVAQATDTSDPDDEPQCWLPLSVLYWHISMHLLSDQLLPGLKSNRPFKLKSWPDFGTFGSDPRLLKLSAFMVRRSLKVSELKKLTQQSSQLIISFINACALNQLISQVDGSGQSVVIDIQQVLADRKHEQGLYSVFSAIRSVFKLRA